MHNRIEVLALTAQVEGRWFADAKLPCRGHSVRLTHNWETALSSIAKDPPDVILIDFDTPGVDGPAFARACRDKSRSLHSTNLMVGIEREGHFLNLHDPSGSNVDFLLSRNGPGVGGVLVEILDHFREFIFELRTSKSPREFEFDLAYDVPSQLQNNRTA